MRFIDEKFFCFAGGDETVGLDKISKKPGSPQSSKLQNLIMSNCISYFSETCLFQSIMI
jgi:hypothetical protein